MSTLQNSPSGFFKRFRLGNLYLKTFPMEKKLTPIFPELRMIKATRFGIRYMPPIAIFTLTWQIALGETSVLRLQQHYLLAVYRCRVCGGLVKSINSTSRQFVELVLRNSRKICTSRDCDGACRRAA